ncbi:MULTISPECIES: hypothetical protein [Rhodomicrobium]|uniref:hypothetical protein n=1 Tax=Rhodomicrobium TaxID=1068 RepID=UPI000B4AC4CD|nr:MULTISPECIES: hypothetical protein [Rhodomicrobium]
MQNTDAAGHHADLLIFDDSLPTGYSPFRNLEYGHYLSFFDAKIVSTEQHPRDRDQRFAAALEALKLDPALKARIVPFGDGSAANGRLAYVTFLANASALLPFFEALELPFIFQLYPGGGFGLDQAESDAKLLPIVASPLCRKIIATQKVTKDYLISRFGCDPARIALVFGGVFESRGDFDFHRDKQQFGRQKDTLDLCFVAHKYAGDLVSKGYDEFVRIATALASGDPRLRFHVVGNYGAGDIALGGAEAQFVFHGRQPSDFFASFYASMDAIISVNRPHVLAPGAFDGFPTGACIEAGCRGVLNCINDPLELNPSLTPGEDFILLDFDLDRTVASLRRLLDDPDELYRLAYANWRKYLTVFDTDRQLWARTRLIVAELARQPPAAMPAARTSIFHPDPVQAAMEKERRRLVAAYQKLEGEGKRLAEAYHVLEGHYHAAEGERKRLERYIKVNDL